MKTIKFILSAILMMMALTVYAQERVVQVYKDGKVVKEYPANEVKSVEYVPVTDYGYYGAMDDTLYKDPNITSTIAAKYSKLISSPAEVTPTANTHAIVLSPNNVKPTIEYFSTLNNRWNVTPATDIEVPTDTADKYSNIIVLNGKTYYIFFTGAKYSPSTTIWRFTIN